MNQLGLMFALFLVFSTLSVNAQDTQTCTQVVKELSFENPSGRTVEQLTRLRTLVMGRCYDPVKAVFISQYVYDQLRLWGYAKATVYDPNNFRVSDANLHPSPIAIRVDFRLTGSDAHLK